jgi:hypothetical protein
LDIREELRKSLLKKYHLKQDPLDGFYAPAEVKEAILAVMISGRHLLLEGPPGTCRVVAITAILNFRRALIVWRKEMDQELLPSRVVPVLSVYRVRRSLCRRTCWEI